MPTALEKLVCLKLENNRDARSGNSFMKMVGPEGLDPTTNRLLVGCSELTDHLPARATKTSKG